ncbi:MAG TPA: TRAP transporter permease [Desulfobacteraceae bacterium]|nr:TRAP transporter permease [Desulfobacteraceae bacterium]
MEEKNRTNDSTPDPKPITADKIKLDEIVQSDAKTGRRMTGFWNYLCSALVIFMVFFYMYNAGWRPVAAQHHRGIYVLITFVLVFLNYPGRSRSPQKRPSVVDMILAGVAAAVVAYWIIEFEALNYRMGNETRLDYIVSTIGIFISLEVCRRVLGWSLTMVGAAFIAYCYFGPYMPEIIAHRGFSFERIVTHVYLKQEGVFGIMADVLVTYVILFIFFGAFLKKSGVGKFFLDLPLALAGRTIGGPAKVAVLASGFFGSVSGSAIANTVSTGAFTIPLMKRTGFRPHVAGAIEPAASVGGMFMPPIMGAGGFLMAEMTGVQYVTIMKMAIFPAFLYFLAVFVMVHFEAKRYGLVGIVEEGAPNAWQILKKEWYMSSPLVIIVVMMLMGYSPGFAAVLATLSCIAVSWLTREYRMGIRQVLEAMLEGGRNTLVIGATVGVIGIIVGSIALTGVGLRFSDIIFNLSGGFLPLAILLIGIASLILGMGVPVTAAYLITAVLAVPAMSRMLSMYSFGMAYGELDAVMPQAALWTLLASHMVVYWFSQDSNITPPVCVAAYAGAAIAGSDPWKTGWTSFKFAKMLYLGPFLFAYYPALLLNGTPTEILFTYLTCALGTVTFSMLTMGYFICATSVFEWIVAALGTVLLLFPHIVYRTLGLPIPELLVDLIAISFFIAVYLMQKYRIKKDPTLTLPITERRKLGKKER